MSDKKQSNQRELKENVRVKTVRPSVPTVPPPPPRKSDK